jgi:hypothetical protein
MEREIGFGVGSRLGGAPQGNGARAGDLASASLVSSTRFIELDAAVRSNNTVRVMARNISGTTIDLGAATLALQVRKRRVA